MKKKRKLGVGVGATNKTHTRVPKQRPPLVKKIALCGINYEVKRKTLLEPRSIGPDGRSFLGTAKKET